MINLNDVTLITIDGKGNDQNAIKALKYSSTHIKFKSIKYITAGSLIPNFCETIKIPKISWNEYNKFCLTNLYEYVDSDYVILIQSDGFIINPDYWTDAFLKYDYIGAPWPKENLRCNIPRWPRVFNQAAQNKSIYQIGNGGFTLRSKKLLYNTKQLYDNSMFELPEDIVISILMREKLESLGLRFVSDIRFAASFSCEAKNIDGIQISAENSLGFHCKDTHGDKVSLLNTIDMEELLK